MKKEVKKKVEKLPKAFKTKWLKALRSGDFKQTTGELQDSEGYCCLGVACRIQHPRMKLEGIGYISKGGFKRLRDVNVPKLIKGEDENPIASKLAGMNDQGESFKTIADYIEKNL